MDTTNAASQEIEGYIEAIILDTIYGWVTVTPVGFSLSVELDGIVIGTGDNFITREDLISRPFAKEFFVKCELPITPLDLVGKRLQVIAKDNSSRISLRVWQPLQEAGNLMNIDLLELKKACNSIPDSYKKNFFKEIGFSKVGLSFGRISSDGFAQVGRNGHLFLLSGRNHLSKLYTGDVVINIEDWLSCFARRRDMMKLLGIRYIQVLIPEKSSVFHDYAPYTASAGSAPYLDLIKLGLDRDLPICDVLPDLIAAKFTTPPYPQNDTHLSTFGAEVVVKTILRFLDEPINYNTAKPVDHLSVGDLGERFAEDGDIREIVPIYHTLYSSGAESQIHLTSSTDPESGHRGRRRIWQNSAAPIKKKVVCFGNSFFERGVHSGHLSWWFSRLFSEFHFIWSPTLDISYVEEFLPDVVICQTIERFLTEVPTS